MIEPEIAFADLEDDMDLAEDMIKYVIALCDGAVPATSWNSSINFVDKGLLDRLNACGRQRLCPHAPTPRPSSMLQKADEQFEYPVNWGCGPADRA